MLDKQTRRISKYVVVLACVSIAGAVNAAPIESLFMSMQATPLFDADAGAQGEWDVPLAGALNGFALDTSFNSFSIADLATFGDPAGSLSWTGNPLVTDNSAGGLAGATFGPGGTFTLSGAVRENFNFLGPDFDGVLITGTISGFSVEEQTLGDNFLDLVVGSFARLTPTGGALVDGTLATMPTDYLLSFTGAEVMQGGGPLTDFASDIQMIDVVNFNLVPVPEPSSIVLLTGMALLVGSRRRS